MFAPSGHHFLLSSFAFNLAGPVTLNGTPDRLDATLNFDSTLSGTLLEFRRHDLSIVGLSAVGRAAVAIAAVSAYVRFSCGFLFSRRRFRGNLNPSDSSSASVSDDTMALLVTSSPELSLLELSLIRFSSAVCRLATFVFRFANEFRN